MDGVHTGGVTAEVQRTQASWYLVHGSQLEPEDLAGVDQPVGPLHPHSLANPQWPLLLHRQPHKHCHTP